MNRERLANGEASRRRLGALVPGLILILLGLWFLLDNFGLVQINMGQLWPVFPLLFGLAMLLTGVVRGRRGRLDEGAIMVGVWGTLIGLFFFLFTFGAVGWDQMGLLWPTFPLIGGLGFLAAFLSSGLRDWGLLIVGAIATLVGVLGYIFTYGVLSPAFAQFVLPYLAPALLILAGIGIVVSALSRRQV